MDFLVCIKAYEYFYNQETQNLFELLSNGTLGPEVKEDILILAVENKYWDLLENINNLNLNECDFTHYTLEDLRKFKELTKLEIPENVFNVMMIEYHDNGQNQQPLIDFFGQGALKDYYRYLINEADSLHDLIKEQIKKEVFPLTIISQEDFCLLVYFTYPEDDFFYNLALTHLGEKFYNLFLNYLINNYSCQIKLYQLFIGKGAKATVKPNIKKFERYTNDLDFLAFLKSL